MKHLLEHYYLLFAMTIVTAAAILLKCICAIVYQLILRESEQMAGTKNKWLRSICTKFEACYQLKMPVYDINTFVRTYLEQYRFLGVSIKSLENSDYLCALVLTGCTLLSIIYGIFYELPAKWIAIHSLTFALFFIFLAFGELLFQVRYKKKMVQLQLVNYFENHLRARLENEYLHPEERAAYQQEYFEKAETNALSKENAWAKATSNEKTAKKNGKTKTAEKRETPLSADMQELIDSLLEEDSITEELEKTQEKLTAAATSEKYQLVEDIIREYL
ncbi:MAG: hypothetical protein SO170_02555 [Butyribacter sp.]|nr:hypothetical protein [bacterium]MDY3853836.1 hypothetical protein [Butyribacter sp.]